MYYWDFVNMQQAPSIVREAAEDIYLMANGEWDYKDIKSTEKMKKIFAEPEELLQKLMDMKPVIGERKLENTAEPEKLMRAVENQKKAVGNDIMWACCDEDEKIWNKMSNEQNTESIAILGLFTLKMVIYKFCMFDFSEISNRLDEKGVDATKVTNTMEEWEKYFWTTSKIIPKEFWSSLPAWDNDATIFAKKKKIRDSYYECFTAKGAKRGFFNTPMGDDYEAHVEALQMAFEDEETVQAVKELQYGGFPNSSQSTNKGGSIKEIQNMRHLLDIMERNLEGRLTEQDKADLKSKAQEWSGDIEKLIHMIAEVKN